MPQVVVAATLYPFVVGTLGARLVASRVSVRVGRPVTIGQGRGGLVFGFGSTRPAAMPPFSRLFVDPVSTNNRTNGSRARRARRGRRAAR